MKLAFTARQIECLSALIECGSDRAAGRKLGISHRTVEHHLALARASAGVKNRLALVLAFDRHMRRGKTK